MSIKLKLSGFDELLKDIENANGKIDNAVESVMRQSAYTMQNELKLQMQKSNVDKALISRMPPFRIEKEYGEITARVGYRKGSYNPDDLSDGFKVLFLNYGTPYRTEHGKIVDISKGGKIRLGFISRAKTAANKKIKKQQEEALNKILERLKRK